MRKRITSLLLLIVLATLSVALGGCSGDKKSDDVSSITIGIPQDLEDSLDPHKATAAGTKEVLFNIFEGLIKPDSDGNFIPAIASDYVIKEEGKVYEFTLRDGVLFHDGSFVTAQDVIYSIERCADTKDGGTPLVSAFSNLESIEAIDEKTIVLTLIEPDTEFLAYMTVAIIPENNDSPETNPIGTGPYKYVSRSPQENIVLEKFDEYWGEAAHIEDVTFKVVANADTIVMNLLGGTVDMYARVTPTQAEQLDDSFQVLSGTMNLVQALYINNAVEPFDDIRVRQALSYAVDKEAILDFVSDGLGTPIASSIFPAFGKYYDDSLNNVYTQNIDKAKELLAEAGYPDGFSFTITVPSNYQQHIDTAQVLAEQFKAINVDAKIQLIEWDNWLSEVYSGRKYETTVVGVDAANLTARALLERFTTTASGNFVNFSDTTYDETFAKAIAEIDDDQKTEYYKECEAILTNQAANVYIQDMPELVALSTKYAGYEFYPLYVQDISKLYIVDEE